MNRTVDLDSLIGAWRESFQAAQAALQAGSPDLPADELRARSQRLAEERVATVRSLDALARDRHGRYQLVRLVAAPWEAKRFLGLPPNVTACVFNADGVLVGSAAIHAEVWREVFDAFVPPRVERLGGTFVPFDVHTDYWTFVHGRTRAEAVREFLASRGISLPEGSPRDPPSAETVHGLANLKKALLVQRLEEGTVDPYEGARLYLELAHDAKLRCGVVSGSTTVETMLERAHLAGLIDERIDGNVAAAEHLRRKPAPDMLLAACHHLGVDPAHTAVFETTPEGVTAGRAGGFELVVAVDQEGRGGALRARGADLVVSDLGDILERALAA